LIVKRNIRLELNTLWGAVPASLSSLVPWEYVCTRGLCVEHNQLLLLQSTCHGPLEVSGFLVLHLSIAVAEVSAHEASVSLQTPQTLGRTQAGKGLLSGGIHGYRW